MWQTTILQFPLWIRKLLSDWLSERHFIQQNDQGRSISKSPILFSPYVADTPTFSKDKNIPIFQMANNKALVVRFRYLEVARVAWSGR